MQHMTFAEVLAKYPDMTCAGLIYAPDRRELRNKEWREWRALLEASEPTFNAIVAWLDGNIPPAKSVTGANGQSAYVLKHPVEWLVGAGYISRGVMEAALLACGYPFKVRGYYLVFGVCGVRAMRKRAEAAMRYTLAERWRADAPVRAEERASMVNGIGVSRIFAP